MVLALALTVLTTVLLLMHQVAAAGLVAAVLVPAVQVMAVQMGVVVSVVGVFVAVAVPAAILVLMSTTMEPSATNLDLPPPEYPFQSEDLYSCLATSRLELYIYM